MGCSRSGTTLLQGLLASHSRVHTFPETGVFLKAFGMRGRLLPWALLGFTLGKERNALAKLLSSQKGAPGALPPLPPRRFLLARSLSDAVGFLDALAAAHGKDIWVEKTPRHVFHARRIRRAVPDSVCIHVVRGGEDVVASIVDRAQRYPGRFPRQGDPSYGIRQWNQSIRATSSALGEPGHVVVFYESLASAVEETLRSLCEILGLGFEAGMLTPADRSTFVGEEEEWKATVHAPVKVAVSKFHRLFDEPTRSRITRGLDSAIFQELKERASGFPGGILSSKAPNG